MTVRTVAKSAVGLSERESLAPRNLVDRSFRVVAPIHRPVGRPVCGSLRSLVRFQPDRMEAILEAV